MYLRICCSHNRFIGLFPRRMASTTSSFLKKSVAFSGCNGVVAEPYCSRYHATKRSCKVSSPRVRSNWTVARSCGRSGFGFCCFSVAVRRYRVRTRPGGHRAGPAAPPGGDSDSESESAASAADDAEDDADDDADDALVASPPPPRAANASRPSCSTSNSKEAWPCSFSPTAEATSTSALRLPIKYFG